MSYTPTEWESTDVVTATRMNSLEQAVGDMNMSYTPNTWSDGDILSAEKMNALEQAVASGGGGSSDFSTAEVTVNASKDIQISAPVIYEAGELSPQAPALINGYTYIHDYDGELTLTMALYKGAVLINFHTEGNVSSAGNITVTGSQALITGDCTITIS